MACLAVGRCRICAQKHKIPVFGGAATQHVFIEKFNFKLIILNTVCIACLAKVEQYIKNMDQNLTYKDFMKEETCDLNDDSTQVPGHQIADSCVHLDSTAEPSHYQSSQEMDVEPQQNRLTSEISGIQNVKCDCGDCYMCSSGLPILADAVDMKSTTALDQLTEQGTYTTLEPSGSHVSYHETIALEPAPHFQLPHVGTSKQSDHQNYIDCSQTHMGEPKQLEDRYSHGYVPQLPGETSHFMDCGADSRLHPTKKHPRDLFCDYCEKRFTHAGDLNKHRRKHTGERPYECTQCQRKFAHASNLARHQRVHSGERPFSCPQCSQSFTRRDKLANHVAGGRCRPRSTSQQHTPT